MHEHKTDRTAAFLRTSDFLLNVDIFIALTAPAECDSRPHQQPQPAAAVAAWLRPIPVVPLMVAPCKPWSITSANANVARVQPVHTVHSSWAGRSQRNPTSTQRMSSLAERHHLGKSVH
jgi:hypothetical protein